MKIYITLAVALILMLSGYAIAAEQPQQTDDHAKVEEKNHPSPDEIIIPGTGKVVKVSELQKNKVIKTGKFKQPDEKNKGSYGSDLAEIIKKNKLIDENEHDTALSIACENGECTYQVIKLGKITTATVQVEQANYAVEQAYTWISDPTNLLNWNLVTTWKVPREPPNKGNQFTAYFSSIAGATSILQPITEWGQTGLKYWLMAPVFVWNAQNIYTNGTRIRVPVGNWIEGGIWTYSPHWWMIWTADRGPSGTASPPLASSTIYIYEGETIGFSSLQLEVYRVDYCNQYPGPATLNPWFNYGLQPTWTAQQRYYGCGLGVQINSYHNVTLKTGN